MCVVLLHPLTGEEQAARPLNALCNSPQISKVNKRRFMLTHWAGRAEGSCPKVPPKMTLTITCALKQSISVQGCKRHAVCVPLTCVHYLGGVSQVAWQAAIHKASQGLFAQRPKAGTGKHRHCLCCGCLRLIEHHCQAGHLPCDSLTGSDKVSRHGLMLGAYCM